MPDIQAEVINRGLVASISNMTIWRWLDEDAIKPWTHRSWIFPRDSAFEPKAARVLDLYAREFEGRELKPDEFVISSDEKTSIQARIRCHSSAAANSHHPMLVEHEYDRGGSLAYIAAWDVHRAKLFGRLEATTGIEPFGRLVNQVMTEEPYCSARCVFWVLDNGSSHRGTAAVRRLQEAHKNLVPVHLPLHASWLNQVEIYFSILQRKVLTPADVASSITLPPTSSPSRPITRSGRGRSSGSSLEPTSPSSSNAWRRRRQDGCPMRHEYITEFMCQST